LLDGSLAYLHPSPSRLQHFCPRRHFLFFSSLQRPIAWARSSWAICSSRSISIVTRSCLLLTFAARLPIPLLAFNLLKRGLDETVCTDNTMRFSTFATALAGITLANAALPPLHIKGSKFFDSNGSQFYIKGVLSERPGRCEQPTSLWPLYILYDDY
jgi:hypothetical protein